MEKKEHKTLKIFAIKILQLMGISEIKQEYTISTQRKEYIIDVVGFFEGKPHILIEVGTNKYEKIQDLRDSGYLVMVIPYSEITFNIDFSKYVDMSKDIINDGLSKRYYFKTSKVKGITYIQVWRELKNGKHQYLRQLGNAEHCYKKLVKAERLEGIIK